jgi:FkbM family methyltransferase
MPQAIYFNDWDNSHIPEILQEIYIYGIYTPYLIGKKDLTIVDIGANIGLASYYFKQFGKVYAVEPSKQHIECLEMMIKQNKIDNIEVCPFAISNVNGKGILNQPPNNTAYTLKNNIGKKFIIGKEEVETMTIKKFMELKKLTKIDFLKLDVEGVEGEIISSSEFKEVCSKIQIIAGEWHQWGSMGKDAFMNTFRDLGYHFKWFLGIAAYVFIAYKLEEPKKII